MKVVSLLILLSFFSIFNSFSQVSGRIIAESSKKAIAGATIKSSKSDKVAVSDRDGAFLLNLEEIPDTLFIYSLGYELTKFFINNDLDLQVITLKETSRNLEEVVVNTGYQALPKERATGSFTHINKKQLNRNVGYGIMERLEGIASGLHFDMAGSNGEPSSKTKIRIHGLSTINGEDQPLIVVDNFPYEGDINNINPNEVESITVLKDAASSSIWGARAGNGVIVITTKKAKIDEQQSIMFSTNIGVGKKPDLFYDPKFIPSNELIDLEILQYKRGIYRENNRNQFSPIIETLFAIDEGLINESEAVDKIDFFRKNDIRKDAEKYLYRHSISSQSFLNIRGRTSKNAYSISAGFDKNLEVLQRQNKQRLTLSVTNDFYLNNNWELQNSINYVNHSAENNGLGIKEIAPEMWNSIYTYAQLKDENGNYVSLPRAVRSKYSENAQIEGLLDWKYTPLEELELNNNTAGSQEIRINSAIIKRFNKALNFEARYQYQAVTDKNQQYHDKNSFYVRNIVNRFTQPDLNRPIPHEGILDRNTSIFISNNARLQAMFKDSWSTIHDLNLLVGLEIREDRFVNDGGKRLYGFDNELMTSYSNIDFNTAYRTRPTGSAKIPFGSGSENIIIDRYLSYFGNAGYSYLDKYLISGSLRWDGSNIFGVDFNQKGVPLWSVGLSWNINKENFFKYESIDYLKLRATYGANGNIIRSQSALPYIIYGYENVVAPWLIPARLGSIGNPSLSWEKVRTNNIGIDFAVLNNRIKGSADWFIKKSENLIGPDYLDPTTGIIPVLTYFNIDNQRNYADMETKGLDLEIVTSNTRGKVKWGSSFLFNYVTNKITNYYTSQGLPITSYLTHGTPAARAGVSRDQIYAIPWHGLNNNGDPLVSYKQELSTDYTEYFNNLTYNDLIPTGVNVAPFFGSLSNSMEYKQLSVSFNITWRAGHKFRKNSISYNDVFATGIQVHKDYLDRWRKPGDEYKTIVPSLPTETNTRRDQAYQFSKVLIENASSVRLQNIQLTYNLSPSRVRSMGLKNISIHSYAQNLGVIWKATKTEVDPDARAIYPKPLQIIIGVQAKF